MERKLSGKQRLRHDILLIIISGLIPHFTMVFINGGWWDDLKFGVCSYPDIRDHFMSAGRFIAYYMLGLIYWMPLWLQHFSVIIINILTAFFIYSVLKRVFKCFDIGDRAALFAAGLYNLVPVNDSRIMECVFPYTLCILLFWIASYLMMIQNERNGGKKISLRILSFALFLLSFSTNSLLVFYCVPVGILFMIIANEELSGGRSFTASIKRWLKYADYCILPFAFFVGKKLVMPPTGIYDDYNTVTMDRCINAIRILPKAIIYDFAMILRNWLNIFREWRWTTALIVLILILFFCRRDKYISDSVSVTKSIAGAVAGLIVFTAGLFPYVVIRQNPVETIGFDGRDSVLLGLGFAITVCFAMKLIRMPEWVNMAVITCCLVLAFIHFGSWYLRYQEGTYEQQALKEMWLNGGDTKEPGEYIYINTGVDKITGRDIHAYQGFKKQVFWTMSAISNEVYGDTGRMYYTSPDEFDYLEDRSKLMPYIKDITYCVDEFDPTHKEINGIIYAESDITASECILLKYYELMGDERFKEMLMAHFIYSYSPLTVSESDKLIYEYKKGNINTIGDLKDICDKLL